jgi:hypothetical protein
LIPSSSTKQTGGTSRGSSRIVCGWDGCASGATVLPETQKFPIKKKPE